MTDRYVALTVTLDGPDDAQVIIDAIKMVKGVAGVVPVVADANAYWAKETAKLELLDKLIQMARET